MPITEFSLIHHIMRLLQAYLTLRIYFGCFGLKLDKLGSYRTFRNAWRCELVYIVKLYKLPCKFRCEMADAVNATRFVTNSYFGGFKRINGHQMYRGAWYNYLEVILKMEDTSKQRECAQRTPHYAILRC